MLKINECKSCNSWYSVDNVEIIKPEFGKLIWVCRQNIYQQTPYCDQKDVLLSWEIVQKDSSAIPTIHW